MCGRFTQSTSSHELARRFAVSLFTLIPRYNIAPTQRCNVIVADSAPGRRAVREMHWGLIPSWTDDPAIGSRMINARAETLAEKPAFREALRKRRCIVPADGFYEWRKNPDRTKTPLHIHLANHEPFALAGLYETWTDRATGEVIPSFTIITVAANTLIRPIHERMPAILGPDAESAWLSLDITDPAALLPLLAPYPADAMAMHAVSRKVNKPEFDAADCIEPVDDEPTTLF